MSEWKENKLGDLLLEKPRNGLYKGSSFLGRGNSYIKMSDLYSLDFINDKSTSELIEATRVEIDRFGCKEGDLLFGRTSLTFEGVGKCSLITKCHNEIIFESNIFRIRPDRSKTSSLYLYYFFKSKIGRDYLKSISSQTAATSIRSSEMVDLILSLPELNTQTAIAEILSSLDDKIELNNKINQELENLTQTLFKQWFIDFEFPNENGEPYKSSGGEMVESELGEIPKGWEIQSLEGIAELVRGISYRKHELVSKEEGVPFVSLKCFALDGTFRQDGLKYFNGKFKDSHVIQADDILVAVTDLTQDRLVIGLPIVWQNDDIALPSLDVCIIRPQEKILKDFLLYEFKTHRYKSRIIEFANGSTVLHLSIKGLETYEIGIPSIDLLSKWSEIVKPILKSMGDNVKENQQLTILRDTLLPKLISGELEVSQSQTTA